jgi:outer membrane protein OmpA-like peptidoglycan-associated protein
VANVLQKRIYKQQLHFFLVSITTINMKNFQKAFLFSLSCGQMAQAQETTTQHPVFISNERIINTSQLEFSPAFYEDGIVFVSSNAVKGKEKVFDDKIGRKTMSIFVALRDTSGKLSKPKPFANELVSMLHEGPLTFDKTGENIYFTRNNNDGSNASYTKGKARLKIYTSEIRASKWGEPTELPFNENESDACHPTISADNDKIFFASNRAGGYGGMDLYVCEKGTDGKWGKPVNLGPKINTAKNEVFPFIHPDGTLFFSSDGLIGAGGLDLFMTQPNKKAGFQAPKNLGRVFNTDKDDFGLIVDLDRKNGYFSSNRSGGVGEDDIYNFHAPESLTEEDDEVCDEFAPITKKGSLLNVLVIDKNTLTEIDQAIVTYTNINEVSLGQLLASVEGKPSDMVTDGVINPTAFEKNGKMETTNEQGLVQMRLPKGGYIFNVKKTGYKAKQLNINDLDKRHNIVVYLDRADGMVPLIGSVLGKDGIAVQGASITLTNLTSGETAMLYSDYRGNFSGYLKCNESYKLTAASGTKATITEMVSTLNAACDKPKNITLKIAENGLAGNNVNAGGKPTITEGTILQLRRIYYNYNDATIRPDARLDLDNLTALLKKYPDVEIELGSHTDSRGKSDYNKNLSQRRADNAVQYLILGGIAPQRVKAVGYGETVLLNRCKDGARCLQVEHQKNRRTEVKIIKSGSATGIKIEDVINQPAALKK